MSVDAVVLLHCQAELVRKAWAGIGGSPGDVVAIGKDGATVPSPSSYPARMTPAAWRDLTRMARRLAAATGHDDERGILVFPDEIGPRKRSYARMVEYVGAGGHWIQLDDELPVRSVGAPSPEQRMARMPKDRPLEKSSRWACFVFPPPGWRTDRQPAAAREIGQLADGTTLLVVRELFSDASALHSFVFTEYVKLAGFVTDPRGLLVLRAGDFAEACTARSYDDLLRTYGSRGGWLER
jgi:hypothetical protein